MKRKTTLIIVAMVTTCLVFLSCKHGTKQSKEFYKMEQVQQNVALVLWNAEDFDFNASNAYYLNMYGKKSENKGGGCSSWRNGHFHGRNLDWFQSDYGCLIVQMPKGGKVKHANVALIDGISSITQEFIRDGVITDEQKKILPALAVDGINDAGVAVNINIVTHAPGTTYIDQEGDLSSQCVVRYILDNAGSVDEAIQLLKGKKIRQSIAPLVGDETHYMISDKNKTAVVEFDNGTMVVTYYENNGKGYYSESGTPAIMTNFYDFAIERWGLETKAFYENHPWAMGVERWKTIRNQYAQAANSIEDNYAIAQSVWYFKNLMVDKKKWYTENAIPSAYGKDTLGWYYIDNNTRIACKDFESASTGFWNCYMNDYWNNYDAKYGNLPDPHVVGNDYWETSHTVIYDLNEKKGYLYPYENRYSKDGKPIIFSIPDGK